MNNKEREKGKKIATGVGICVAVASLLAIGVGLGRINTIDPNLLKQIESENEDNKEAFDKLYELYINLDNENEDNKKAFDELYELYKNLNNENEDNKEAFDKLYELYKNLNNKKAFDELYELYKNLNNKKAFDELYELYKNLNNRNNALNEELEITKVNNKTIINSFNEKSKKLIEAKNEITKLKSELEERKKLWAPYGITPKLKGIEGDSLAVKKITITHIAIPEPITGTEKSRPGHIYNQNDFGVDVGTNEQIEKIKQDKEKSKSIKFLSLREFKANLYKHAKEIKGYKLNPNYCLQQKEKDLKPEDRPKAIIICQDFQRDRL